MEQEIKWIIGFAVVLFGGLFGAITYSDHLEQAVKLECIKEKGQYIKGSCVFRN